MQLLTSVTVQGVESSLALKELSPVSKKTLPLLLGEVGGGYRWPLSQLMA